MFEIREHMEITDANGQRVGTVDAVEGDMIKVTSGDAPDSLHFQLPVSTVEKVEGDRIWLKAGTFLPKAAPAGLHTHSHHGGGGEKLFGTSGHGTGMGGSGVGN